MADEVPGTATEEIPNDPAPEPETTETPEGGATETPPAEPAKVESFIDPSTLPPELKSHWSSMHRAYTKKLEGINARKGDLDFLDQYRSNPEVAKQVLQQEAARLGLTLATGTQPAASPNGSPAPPASPSGQGVPPELVKAIEDQLPAELKWMAPAQAAASWAATRMAVAPLVQESQQTKQATRQAEYDRLAGDLAATAPGWEEHEQTMHELLAYLKSPALTHPTFGSKLALLHGVVTKDARARVAAAESMGAAARNRTTTGQSGRSVTPNITEQVLKAKRGDDIQIAADAAIAELKAKGVLLPA